jgi:hypothetical protein
MHPFANCGFHVAFCPVNNRVGALPGGPRAAPAEDGERTLWGFSASARTFPSVLAYADGRRLRPPSVYFLRMGRR